MLAFFGERERYKGLALIGGGWVFMLRGRITRYYAGGDCGE